MPYQHQTFQEYEVFSSKAKYHSHPQNFSKVHTYYCYRCSIQDSISCVKSFLHRSVVVANVQVHTKNSLNLKLDRQNLHPDFSCSQTQSCPTSLSSMGTTFRLPFLATPPYIYIVFANALLEGNTTHWIWTLLQFESREILLIKNVFVSLA